MSPEPGTGRHRPGTAGPAPTVREIRALLARLRTLTAAGPDADPTERAAFLADKADLIARITEHHDRELDGGEHDGGSRDASEEGPATALSGHHPRAARASELGRPDRPQGAVQGVAGGPRRGANSANFPNFPQVRSQLTTPVRNLTPGPDLTARSHSLTPPVPTPRGPTPRETASGSATRPGPVSGVRGLPLPALVAHPPQDDTVYVVTAVDARGRLAALAPVRALGWAPGHPVLLYVLAGSVVIAGSATRDEAGRRALITTAITGQGHLRLPATVRHGCRLDPGARLLVAAHPDAGVLVVVTVRALDGVVRAYVESLLAPDGGGGW